MPSVGGGRRVPTVDGSAGLEPRLRQLSSRISRRGTRRPTPAATVDPNLGAVVVAEEELQARIAELGKEITADYDGRAPLLVGVLKGAFVFMTDLARAIDLPVEFDFMAVSSYGSATKTSGVVRIVKDLDLDLTDRHVLLVEDIVDSGLTLAYLRKNLLARDPASLEVCALLVRDGPPEATIPTSVRRLPDPARVRVGYGLDVDERYRNLPVRLRVRGRPRPSVP